MQWTTTLKVTIARILTCNMFGRVIAYLFQDRIPSGPCKILTRYALLTPREKASIFWGLYERAELSFCRSFLSRDLDIVELGSSIGVVSSHLGTLSARRLVCVEANPDLAAVAKSNIALNCPGRPFTVLNRAIDYHPSKRPLVGFAGGGDTISGHIVEPEALDARYLVETTTLSRLLSDTGIEEYVLVADIEGAEAAIVLNDGEALLKCRQMVIETHASPRMTAVEIVQKITERGFTVTGQRGPVYVLEQTSGKDV